MGKKNKVPRRRRDDDDDDLLLGPPSDPPPSSDVEEDEGEANDDDDDDDGSNAEATPVAEDTPAPKVEDTPAPKVEEKPAPKVEEKQIPSKPIPKSGGGGEQKFSGDLAAVEAAMTKLLRNYPSKPDDWLHRTIEKNLGLKKKSLKGLDEEGVLDEMRKRVDKVLDEEMEGEEEDKGDEKIDGGDGKDEGDVVMDAATERRLRAEARMNGWDPDEAVAMALSGNSASDREGEGDGGNDGNDSKDVDQGTLTGASSLLLSLKRSSQSEDSMALITVLYSLIYAFLSVLCGGAATARAEKAWTNIHEPAIRAKREADQLAEDKRLIGSHLWSENTAKWIARDATYPPPESDDEATATMPTTVRYNQPRKQWQRWAKNLSTRTRASGSGETLTKGVFNPVKPGEGWAGAPTKPEVPSEGIADGDVHFYACIPESGEENEMVVVDVTSWAVAALMTKETAKKLGAVDSGRPLFQFEIPSSDEKKGKKGKGKGKKQKQQRQRYLSPEEEEEEAYILLKGMGATAKICDRYVDAM